MKPLVFKTIYMDLIKNGKKTQTIRKLEKFPVGCYPGAHFKATNYKESIPLLLLGVTQRDRSKLSEHDAIADGFSCLYELDQVLSSFYGNDDFLCTIFEFSLI